MTFVFDRLVANTCLEPNGCQRSGEPTIGCLSFRPGHLTLQQGLVVMIDRIPTSVPRRFVVLQDAPGRMEPAMV